MKSMKLRTGRNGLALLVALALSGVIIPPARAASPREVTMERLLAYLDRFWEKNPYPAVRGQCVDGWRYYLVAGEPGHPERERRVLERLREIQMSGAPQAFAASAALLAADRRGQVMHWEGIAANASLPLEDRLRALAVVSPYTKCPESRLPDGVDALCREVLSGRESEYWKGILESLGHADYSAETGQAVVTVLERYAARWERGSPLRSGEECIVLFALEALRRLPVLRRAESAGVLQRLMDAAPSASVCVSAAATLAKAGQAAAANHYCTEALLGERDPARRIELARVLVAHGEAEYRGELIEAMRHSDWRVRHKAYFALLHLADQAFIENAIADSRAGGLSSVHPVFEPLNIDSHLSPSASSVRGELAWQYVSGLYLRGLSDEAKAKGLEAFLINVPSPTYRILDELREVLDEPLPKPVRYHISSDADVAAHTLRMLELQCLLRGGSEEDQTRALALVKEMYEAEDNDDVLTGLIYGLGRTQCDAVQPFLLEVAFDGKPTKYRRQVRTGAVVSWLAIEAGEIWQ